jgi:hypothetical protein
MRYGPRFMLSTLALFKSRQTLIEHARIPYSYAAK